MSLRKILINNEEIEVRIHKQQQDVVKFSLNGKEWVFHASPAGPDYAFSMIGEKGQTSPVVYQRNKGEYTFFFPDKNICVSEKRALANSAQTDDGQTLSPMPGKVVKVFVSVGQQVKKGDPIMAMEAMKMEHTITAKRDGVVKSLKGKEGEQLEGNVVVVEIVAIEKHE